MTQEVLEEEVTEQDQFAALLDEDAYDDMLSDSADVEIDVETDEEALKDVARLLNVEAIATLQDVPSSFIPSQDTDVISVCRTHGRIIASEQGTVLLASFEPSDYKYISDKLRPVLKKARGIAIHPASFEVVDSLLNKAEARRAHSDKMKSSDITSEERSAAQKGLDDLIANAIRAAATDIHIIMDMDFATILYRIKGRIVHRDSGLPVNRYKEMLRAAINYDAVLGAGQASKTFDENSPNDASFSTYAGGVEVQIRFASAPAKNGGHTAVLRILGANIGGAPTLEGLRYLPEHVLVYKQATNMPFGAIVISGPTGSGKSTTLRATMALIPDHKRVYTFEDPIEADMPNATQCPVNEDNPKTTFLSFAKASLRLDPNVLMYGELREKDVTKVFLRASTTGHLVLTTLHTNTAIDIVPALADLGISHQRLADPTFLRVLGAQRLLPAICQECRVVADGMLGDDIDDARLAEHFGDVLNSVYITNPVGCEKCNFTGNAGSRLIAEVINVDGLDRDYIASGDTNGWLKHLKSKGWRDMKDHAEILVRAGELCLREADKELTTGFGIDTAQSGMDYNKIREFAERTL